MIAYLTGKILKKTEKGVILKTENIGYFVYLATKILAEITENRELELFIHQHIREDANDLYGFSNFEELSFFKQLIQINGIGPKLGLEILSVNTNSIKSAIINEDSALLCKIPGIGSKMAKRIILELKGKIELEQLPVGLLNKSPLETELHIDAIEALVRLGYQKHQITKTLRDMPEEIIEAEGVITYFLKNI